MIQPTELRINNWVYSIQLAKEVQISGIDYDGDLTFIGEVTWDYNHYDSIEPIPLSEETLLKCGFIETKEGYIKALSNNSNIGLIEIKDRFMVSMACPYGLFQSKSIMNLHQLQNLYFALTNQELIYTP